MPQHTQLQAADGHKFDAYIAQPTGEPRAGIVVLQEIFGVNAHIRSIADGFARVGYLTIAPALFDRSHRDVELAATPESSRQGMAIAHRISPDEAMQDIAAAIEYLREHSARKVGIIGYSWGGALAWLSNTRLHPDATVSYYPGKIQNIIQEKPTCPASFHFGLRDAHISRTVVEQVQKEHPVFPVFTYEGAGHGFNNDTRPSYNAAAAKLAQQRTLAHFERYLITRPR